MGTTDEVRAALDRLAADFMRRVVAVAREAAFERIAATLPAESAAQLRARVGLAAPAPETRTVPASPRPKGTKRPPAELATLRDRLRRTIAERPGLRVEQINRLLGTATRDVARPLRQLVAAGLVRTEGEKRSTVYLPGDAATITPSVPVHAVGPRRRPRRGADS